MEENKIEKKYTSNAFLNIALGLGLFNTALNYILHYSGKVGTYHVWICSIIGVLLVLFAIYGIVQCIKIVKSKTAHAYLAIIVSIMIVIYSVVMTLTILPYYKDLFAEAKTVTTDYYCIMNNHLYFYDSDKELEIINISTKTADELSKIESYGSTSEYSVSKHNENITIKYHPNSKVTISVTGE